MQKFVAFGEIMLRLTPPSFLRIGQARSFEIIYGGGESNVAVSLANFGLPVEYVTRLPKNDLGVEIVKLFPGAQAGGPAFIKNLRGPMPYVRILPTGGVEPTEANLRGWFEAGAAAVGMGSNLVRSDWVAAGDYESIRRTAAQALEWIRSFRSKNPLDQQ